MFSVFHFGLTANNAHTLSTDPGTPLRSHVRFHLRQSLTWGFAFLLTAVPAAFVSRSASFRTGRGQMNRHPCDRAAVNGFRPSPPSLTRCRRAATVLSTEAASLRTYGDASRYLVTGLTVEVDVEARSNPQRDCDGVIHGPPREPACLFVNTSREYSYRIPALRRMSFPVPRFGAGRWRRGGWRLPGGSRLVCPTLGWHRQGTRKTNSRNGTGGIAS